MEENILIVDDDSVMVDMLSTILERSGYKPLKALTVKKAMEIIGKSPPDLVLLDIMMPDTDGFFMLSMLREDPSTEDLPVVIISAKTEKEDILKGWRLKADGYITKPFELKDLIRVIGEVLARTKEERHMVRKSEVESLRKELGFSAEEEV